MWGSSSVSRRARRTALAAHHEFRSSVNDAPAEVGRAVYTQLVFTH